MPTKGHPGTSPTRRARGSTRGGATHTIRIGYGHPDRPFAIRRMVLKKVPSHADTMDFVLVAEEVYVKALMPARPLPPSISDAPDAVLNVVAHEVLEGVWVRLNSRIGEAEVETG
ncbi:MAG: hypothetical protein QME77_09905 [bacterium]|nr:hypothetical protein [bacterium]